MGAGSDSIDHPTFGPVLFWFDAQAKSETFLMVAVIWMPDSSRSSRYASGRPFHRNLIYEMSQQA
jgi:hypothetical protein